MRESVKVCVLVLTKSFSHVENIKQLRLIKTTQLVLSQTWQSISYVAMSITNNYAIFVPEQNLTKTIPLNR